MNHGVFLSCNLSFISKRMRQIKTAYFLLENTKAAVSWPLAGEQFLKLRLPDYGIYFLANSYFCEALKTVCINSRWVLKQRKVIPSTVGSFCGSDLFSLTPSSVPTFQVSGTLLGTKHVFCMLGRYALSPPTDWYTVSGTHACSPVL